jgi:hypothetical protein
MTSLAYALAREELVRAITAYTGIATADGAADGTTIIDSNLIGRNDFISEKTILIMTGDAANEDKGALLFDNVSGTITLQGTGFSAQVKAGTIYRILNISTTEIDVAAINDKIGTNTDPAGTATLFAWLAKIFDKPSGGSQLAYWGRVTDVYAATAFRSEDLAGIGEMFFANTYRVYVVRDAGGGAAAPQGEMQPCLEYYTDEGIFVHTEFTTGLAEDDEVLLIHERIAEIADLLIRLGDPSAHTLTSLTAKWGDTARSLALILGSRWDAAGDLGTDIENILLAIASTMAYVDELETRLTDARAGYLDELNMIKGATGIFHEQPDVPVNINAVNTAETDFLHLNATDTRDELRITVRASAGGPYAVTGQYSYAKTNV